jgi:capsular polysaccharide biosynthesis protein
MVSTLVNQGPVEAYKFFENELSIRLPPHSTYIELGSGVSEFQAPVLEDDRILDLVSDNKKLLATMHPSFYHFYIDFVGRIVDQLKIDPDIELIIHNPMLSMPAVGGSYVFDSFLETLKSKGIKHRVYDLKEFNIIRVNNVYLSHMPSTSKDYSTGVFEFFSDYVRNPGITPHRDIFLSRKHMGDRVYPNAPTWAWAGNDNRIDSHDDIENYFISLGYEIIIPESLNSFEEQMNTFYEARTIVSTTSSGLTNAVFMQPGQTMVELVTPLVIHVAENANADEMDTRQWRVQEELHHFYSVLALHKKHKFLMLGNKYRKSEDIIKQIEDDEILKRFLSRR